MTARAGSCMLKALAVAKHDYVASVFDICAQLGCRAFASIVETNAHPTAAGIGLSYEELLLEVGEGDKGGQGRGRGGVVAPGAATGSRRRSLSGVPNQESPRQERGDERLTAAWRGGIVRRDSPLIGLSCGGIWSRPDGSLARHLA